MAIWRLATAFLWPMNSSNDPGRRESSNLTSRSYGLAPGMAGIVTPRPRLAVYNPSMRQDPLSLRGFIVILIAGLGCGSPGCVTAERRANRDWNRVGEGMTRDDVV